MLLSLALSLALSQQPAAPAKPQKIEIIRGGSKNKKAAPVTSTDDRDAELAAKAKALDAKQRELDAKHQELEAKNQALDAKQRDLDEREEASATEKEEQKKRSGELKKQAERHARDQAAAMDDINGALGGN